MRKLSELRAHSIECVFTDIDGTLTKDGQLPRSSYSAMWDLFDQGFHVIPVTGRPAGWCELIARLWPVHGVIGENGALYYRYDKIKMRRHYWAPPESMNENRRKLDQLAAQILKEVPGSAVASDQFARIFDLAIDFAEDVNPLPAPLIQEILKRFQSAGATAKVSSIHVNGWFGNYDKLSMCREYLTREFGFNSKDLESRCAFIGDSPNDEPMFGAFPLSFAVANIRAFKDQVKQLPQYVTEKAEGEGFAEFAQHLIQNRSR